MSNLLMLCNLLWFFVCLTALVVKRRKDSREIAAEVDQVRRLFNGQEEMRIVFVDYSDPAFKETDTLLASDTVGRFIVVFRAPAWLIVTKEKKWRGHQVIDAEKFNFRRKNTIIVTREGKYEVYDDIVSFMKFSAAYS